MRALLLGLLVLSVPDLASPCDPPYVPPLPQRSSVPGSAAVDGEGVLHLIHRGVGSLTWSTMSSPWEAATVRASVEVDVCGSPWAPRVFPRPDADGIDVIAPCRELVHFRDSGPVLSATPSMNSYSNPSIGYDAEGARILAGSTDDGLTVWRQEPDGAWTLLARRSVASYDSKVSVVGDDIYVSTSEGYWLVEPLSGGLWGLPIGDFAFGAAYERTMGVDEIGEPFFAWAEDDQSTYRVFRATPANGGFEVQRLAEVPSDGRRNLLTASRRGDAFAVTQVLGPYEAGDDVKVTFVRREGADWHTVEVGSGPWFERADYGYGAMHLFDDGKSLLAGSVELRLLSLGGEGWTSRPIALIGSVLEEGEAYQCGGPAIGFDGCATGQAGAASAGVAALVIVARSWRRRRSLPAPVRS